ncbi:MarR family winged helix-turn-helix transcriptional regulator [Lactococcus protaetiae]|uniref:MarR family transcriptional regulator n=1 Tax=Lactococcus protaetiae TaxID=2592653 RepID=A0A514ZA30_9LACT|nr:MarR family transcriptional regulator [Lactococcus protaetiae]MCL2113575.1 MarR family transcriptional regulator [Streptococcaceae bacterium]QDK71438.1 MarR family transcriptional regulator [Lactococcus protaetiae]
MDYNQLAENFFKALKSKEQVKMWGRMNGYTQGEHQVLFYLYKNAGKDILPSDIAKYTGTSTARVATILNNLEEKGLVTREISREDRRKILVSITGKGRDKADASRCRFIQNIARIFEEMGEERTQNFIENFQLFIEIGMKYAQEEKEKNK